MMLLRPDGDTDAIPDEARKWADPDNHMGVDAENEVTFLLLQTLFRTVLILHALFRTVLRIK
jgi:hypothetical protein